MPSSARAPSPASIARARRRPARRSRSRSSRRVSPTTREVGRALPSRGVRGGVDRQPARGQAARLRHRSGGECLHRHGVRRGADAARALARAAVAGGGRCTSSSARSRRRWRRRTRQDIVHRDLKPENVMLVGGAGGRGRSRCSTSGWPSWRELERKLELEPLTRARHVLRHAAVHGAGADRRARRVDGRPICSRSASSPTRCSRGGCRGTAPIRARCCAPILGSPPPPLEHAASDGGGDSARRSSASSRRRWPRRRRSAAGGRGGLLRGAFEVALFGRVRTGGRGLLGGDLGRAGGAGGRAR